MATKCIGQIKARTCANQGSNQVPQGSNLGPLYTLNRGPKFEP